MQELFNEHLKFAAKIKLMFDYDRRMGGMNEDFFNMLGEMNIFRKTKLPRS